MHCDSMLVIYASNTMSTTTPERRQHVRKLPDTRKSELLAAALAIAKLHGVEGVTRASVAREVGVSDGLINRYFGGRDGLRWAAVAEAGKRKCLHVLRSALDAGYARKDIARVTDKATLAEL